MRRLRRRMDARRLTSLGEYRDHLELEPEEFSLLFDSLLINVTGFFRDPPAWQALREMVLPEPAVRQERPPAAAGLERRVRDRRGGLHAGHRARGGHGPGRVRQQGEDLRDRPRRGRPGGGTRRRLYRRQVAEVHEELRQKYFEASARNTPFAATFAGR